jgi:hypothetical protein
VTGSLKIRGLTPSALLTLARARRVPLEQVRHVFLAIGDHYEPMWSRPARSVQQERVERWVREYPRMAGGVSDSRGRPPQHSFFYPQDEYDPQLVEPIAELCRNGWGDVEVHLHHDHDTADGLREKLLTFTADLHERHGMLRRDPQGRLSYGFIHGNWALDNSRCDGRWCGVNNEIEVLLETGCYADFTMPSAPADCQTSTMNSIYYAVDDPAKPKSHDTGQRAAAGRHAPQDSLLMIQGPLALDWSRRKYGVLPGIENGDLTGIQPPTRHRFDLWRQAHVHVAGREDWLFVKLHTHGAQERNSSMLLGEPMRRFHSELKALAQQQQSFRYYYVTAHEMAGLVHQAEAGRTDPDWETLGKVGTAADSAGSVCASKRPCGV